MPHTKYLPVSLACIALLLAGPALALEADLQPHETLKRVRIFLPEYDTQYQALIDEGWDIFGGNPVTGEAQVMVSYKELDVLVQRGFAPAILDIGKPLVESMRERFGESAVRWVEPELRDFPEQDAVPAGYKTYNEILNAMQGYANQYPGLATRVNLSSYLRADRRTRTWQGRAIFALKISDNVEAHEDEPSVMWAGCHHAREIMTPEFVLDVADYLLSNYAGGSTKDYVDNNEIWLIPVVNPDGYIQVLYVDNNWRKNLRDTCTNNANDGVDLNRNYKKDFATCGGTTNPCDFQTYRGPFAESEPEIVTMTALARFRNLAMSIDYHSSGREVLWGYRNGGGCPQVNSSMTGALIQTRNNIQAAANYGQRAPSAGGESFEWQFWELGSHAFLLETGTSFQPAFSAVATELARLRPTYPVVLDRVESHQVRGNVTNALNGNPLTAKIEVLEENYTGGETRWSQRLHHGRYQVFLLPGSYNLRVSKAGFTTQTIPFTVNAGVPTEIDVQLQ